MDAPPVLYLDTAGKGFDEEEEPTTHSLLNPGEAGYVVARVRQLLGLGLSPREVAVIAPYSAQARHLREALEAVHPEVEVDTVDAFQGRRRTPSSSASPAPTARGSWASSMTCAA